MKNEIYLYDIEVYPNYFLVGLKNYVTKQKILYEISEERDDRKQIYDFFTNFDGYLVSFNGIHYDNMVMSYFLTHYRDLTNYSVPGLLGAIKAFSDKAINQDDFFQELKTYKYYKKKWTDVDLFLYWSKLLRLSKKISLKSLGIQLGYPVVQELPFAPSTVLKREDLEVIRQYNGKHDLGILEMLTVRMKEDIKLRESVRKDYGLHCMSWDAPKIASEALLLDYCSKTNKDLKEVRNTRFNKPTLYIRDVLKGFDPEFKLPVFKQLFSDMLNSVNEFSQEIVVNESNTCIRLTYGVGGLHSVNKNETYESGDKFQVVTSDFASLYPNLIINYKTIRFPEVLARYFGVKAERLIAKKAGDKRKDTFFKLILNSISGLLDNVHSWLYYPEGAMRLRLIGQLILTKVVETCILNNWQVVSCNTDGIEVIIPKEDMIEVDGKFIGKYPDVLKSVEKQFNLDLEHEIYRKIVYANVNNYIAITEKGKVKRKGFFKLDFDEKGNPEIPLGDSVNELVVPKMLNLYYTKGIKAEEVLNEPEKFGLKIYDFCRSNKIDKSYTVYWNQEQQQRLNRYYVCPSAPYLYKQKRGKKTMENVLSGWGVMIYNEHVEKPLGDYNVDTRYYLSKVNEVITEINGKNQLKLELF